MSCSRLTFVLNLKRPCSEVKLTTLYSVLVKRQRAETATTKKMTVQLKKVIFYLSFITPSHSIEQNPHFICIRLQGEACIRLLTTQVSFCLILVWLNKSHILQHSDEYTHHPHMDFSFTESFKEYK